MFRDQYHRRAIKTTATYVAAISGGLIPGLVAITRIAESLSDASTAPWERFIYWASGFSPGLMLICACLLGLAEVIRLWAGNPTFWLSVEPVLDELCEYSSAQERRDADPIHHHRATLFRYVRFKFWIWPWRNRYNPWGGIRNPWSGWLVPVSRSGHTTKKTRALFLAPDDADNAEGIAGHVWRCRGIIGPIDLPEVNKNSPDDEIEAYAKAGFVSSSYVRKQLARGTCNARCISGFPVFKHGRIWGVVVLDSRRHDGIKEGENSFPVIEMATHMLEKLVIRHT